MAEPVSSSIALVGLSGLGAAQSMSEAQQQRRQAQADNRLRQAQTGLELARQRNETAFALGKTLARQNVGGGARGVAASSGSLMRQALAASRQARRQTGLAEGGASLRTAGTALDQARADARARSASSRALISFGQSLARRGPTIFR